MANHEAREPRYAWVVVAPPSGGVIHDLTGSYTTFFAAAALLAAAATGIAWAISETQVVGSLQTPAT